ELEAVEAARAAVPVGLIPLLDTISVRLENPDIRVTIARCRFVAGDSRLRTGSHKITAVAARREVPQGFVAITAIRLLPLHASLAVRFYHPNVGAAPVLCLFVAIHPGIRITTQQVATINRRQHPIQFVTL